MAASGCQSVQNAEPLSVPNLNRFIATVAKAPRSYSALEPDPGSLEVRPHLLALVLMFVELRLATGTRQRSLTIAIT